MRDLDRELWAIGIPSKTRHNEVAPAQHELAPVFSTSNQAVDNIQLILEFMKKVAYRHNLACLLHEKPFEGVNGSGKHNNWAMSTDTGENLLKPGAQPEENYQFLTFLTAIIEAVDRYPELMRITVASAGNDHRLGANEAPPAIVSVFLGEQLDNAIKHMTRGDAVTSEDIEIDTGVDVIPNFMKDKTDRNRTSPFAFTGNKFEFRMLGSNQSIADPNIVLNTIVAEVLGEYADILEKVEEDSFQEELKKLLTDRIMQHKRIIFNGNNYSDEWVLEAERRGLPNLKTTPEALNEYCSRKNVDLFVKHGIMSETEMLARREVYLEEYSKTLNIEVKTMLSMLHRQIIPACLTYAKDLGTIVSQKKALSIDAPSEEKLLKQVTALTEDLLNETEKLKAVDKKGNAIEDPYDQAVYFESEIIPQMAAVRAPADELETLVGEEYWPYPIYEDLLFYV